MKRLRLALPKLPDASPPGVVPGSGRQQAYDALLNKPVYASTNANLPVGSAAMDGKILVDETNDRLVYYSNGQRRWLAAGTLF